MRVVFFFIYTLCKEAEIKPLIATSQCVFTYEMSIKGLYLHDILYVLPAHLQINTNKQLNKTNTKIQCVPEKLSITLVKAHSEIVHFYLLSITDQKYIKSTILRLDIC